MSFSHASLALSPFWAGLGNTTHNFLSAQADKDGGTKKFEIAPTVFLGATLPVWQSLYFSPGIGFTMFTGEQDKTSKTELHLQYHVTGPLIGNVFWITGFSNFITSISGEGGTTELNNGGGTATFYVPKESSTSYTSSLDFGAEFMIDSNWTTRLEFYITRFLSSDRRKVSNMFSLNYFF